MIMIMGDIVSEPAVESIKPVYFYNSDVDQDNGNYLTVWEICTAVSEILSGGSKAVDGAQRIGGLWRIYLKNSDDRVLLLSSGINIRGLHITLKDKNPFLISGRQSVESTRLYVRNIPLSFDNEVITNELKSMGVEMLGTLKYARARTPQGQLTNFKTGDRFVEIVVPGEPLPKKKDIGIFTASLYHKEQKQKIEDIECGNCKEKGHMRRDCVNDPVCFSCLKSGHKRGSMLCPAFAGVRGTSSKGRENVQVNEEDDDLYETDKGGEEADESEDAESDSGSGEDDDGENKSENETKVVPDTVQVTETKTPEEQKKPEESKSIPQNLWSAAAQMSPLGRTGSPARARKLDERSPDTGADGKKKKKKKK